MAHTAICDACDVVIEHRTEVEANDWVFAHVREVHNTILDEADVIEAINYAMGVIQQLNDLQREIVTALGEPKMSFEPPANIDEGLQQKVHDILLARERYQGAGRGAS